MKSIKCLNKSLPRPGTALSTAAIIVCAAVLILSRLLNPGADPPVWAASPWISDSGWWSASARSSVIAGSYMQGDFGMPLIIAPLYTLLLELVFRAASVTQSASNLLSGFAQAVTAAVASYTVFRLSGIKAGAAALIMLSICPLFAAYSKVSFPESLQVMFLTISISLMITGRPGNIRLIFSGIVLTCAVLVKLNSLVYILVPHSAAVITAYIKGRNSSESQRLFPSLKNAALPAASCALSTCVVLIAMLATFGGTLAALLSSESGTASGLKDMAIHAGASLTSQLLVDNEVIPVIWTPFKFSPLILLGGWILLILRASGSKLENILTFHGTWCITFLLIFFTGGYQNDYRLITLLPVLAPCSAALFPRLVSSFKSGLSMVPGGDIALRRSYCLWCIILLPAVITVKPAAVSFLVELSQTVSIGSNPGISAGSAGYIFFACFFIMVLPLSAARKTLHILLSFILTRAVIPLSVLLLFYELGITTYQTVTPEYTLKKAQSFAARISEGRSAGGRFSATLFLESTGNVIRRSSPSESPDRENFASFVDMAPEFLVYPDIVNHSPYPPAAIPEGYFKAESLAVGPFAEQVPRFNIVIYRRSPSHDKKKQ